VIARKNPTVIQAPSTKKKKTLQVVTLALLVIIRIMAVAVVEAEVSEIRKNLEKICCLFKWTKTTIVCEPHHPHKSMILKKITIWFCRSQCHK